MRRLLAALLVLLMLAAPAARAQTPDDSPLDLTADQTAALKVIREKYEVKRHDLYLRLHAKKGELGDILCQDEPDKAAVKAKLDEIMGLEGERQRLFLDEIFEVKPLLKPPQWKHYIRKVVVYITGGGHRH